jgi:hypothetical protein
MLDQQGLADRILVRTNGKTVSFTPHHHIALSSHADPESVPRSRSRVIGA